MHGAAGQSREVSRPPTDATLDTGLAAAARLVVETFAAAPCAVVAAARRRANGTWVRGCAVAGRLERRSDASDATTTTPFDLASVTKPFTALAALRLARAGLLDLEAPLSHALPALRGSAAGERPLALILRHRAGLEAHRPLFAPLTRGEAVDRAAALLEAAGAMPADLGVLPGHGAPALYSDLGYLLAGAALARVAGRPLDELLRDEVALPAGSGARSARLHRLADSTFDDRVAPTEVVQFRGGTVRGAVHDENAWAIAGDGSCGHAGLFGTADDVLALGELLMVTLAGERGDWLDAEALGAALAPWPGGSHVLGFDTRSGPAPSAGTRFGPRTFGHLGFTGTSLWVDPDASLVGVLLTNRVHPTRDHVAIRAARPVVYDAIAACAEEAMGLPTR